MSTSNTPTILGPDGLPMIYIPKEDNVLEFFAWGTVGRPPGAPRELEPVERRPDGSWGPKGSRIGRGRESATSSPPVSG